MYKFTRSSDYLGQSLSLQMPWHLEMPTLVVEVVISCWTMSAALGQSLLSWSAHIQQVSIAPLVIKRMLE